MFSPSTLFLKKNFAHENLKKPALKVAKPAQIQHKSQFLFHKNLPPRDFSILSLPISIQKCYKKWWDSFLVYQGAVDSANFKEFLFEDWLARLGYVVTSEWDSTVDSQL